jgi:hypothetical protein
MPMANPIRVLLVMIWTMTGHWSSLEPLEAIPKQMKPKTTPDNVATMIRFVLCMISSFYNLKVIEQSSHSVTVLIGDASTFEHFQMFKI